MSWVLYGATGYSGQLLAEEAVRRGHRPLLAGRSETKLRSLGERLELPWRAVSLEDSAGLRALLDGSGAVLHAAGPFIHTSRPMVDACLDARVHYLDLTGELSVFEAVYGRDEHAKARGVGLLPGAGFDVVPTDCLAASLMERLPGATRLELAVAIKGRPSHGTLKSLMGVVARGAVVRRAGALVSQPWGEGLHRVRFSRREAWVMPAPLGDLMAAALSTGVPDLMTSVAVPARLARTLQRFGPARAALTRCAKVLSTRLVEGAAGAIIDAMGQPPPAPSASAEPTSFIWGAAQRPDGQRVEAWLETCDGYRFTSLVAITLVERILASTAAGALTPSRLAGPDLVLTVEGTRRFDRLP